MSQIKLLFFMFIFEFIPQGINNLGIKINVSGKSKAKTNGQSCVSNNDCGFGLTCISYICSCEKNEYWNSSYCVTKLLLYFTSSNYTTVNINQFNGTSFKYVTDVKVIEKPNYYIYVSGSVDNLVVQLNQSGSYIRQVSLPNATSIQPVNNSSIYATSFTSKILYKFDSSLTVEYNSTPANSTYVSSPRRIRYNPSNGYLYQCDVDTGYVNVFDLQYNRIANESLKFRRSDAIYGIDFYHSKILGDLIFVTTFFNKIYIVKQSNQTIIKTLSPVCFSGLINEILIDQKSGYFLVSCYNDQVVQLWYIDGTSFIYTGKYIGVAVPSGMCFDSYGRLMIAKTNSSFFSIYTPFDYPF